MIHTITFNLPDDEEDLRITMKAMDNYIMITEALGYARSLSKHESREQIPTEEVEEKIREIFSEFERG